MKITATMLVLCVSLHTANAQPGENQETVQVPAYSTNEWNTSNPNYEIALTHDKTEVRDRSPWAYPHLREADVSYSRRYERIIDARQKQNLCLRYPKLPLISVLMKSIQKGEVEVFNDKEFKDQIDMEAIQKKITTVIIVGVPDSIDQSIIHDVPVTEVTDLIDKTIKFRIIEEWIFDKNLSEMVPRIVAIAPLYKPVVANGQIELPEQPLCWIKFEDLRPTFANSEVFNTKNDGARVSLDHFFQARMFASYIVKEPNVYDNDIKDFEEFRDNGIAALLESDRIRNDLFIVEHDVWEY